MLLCYSIAPLCSGSFCKALHITALEGVDQEPGEIISHQQMDEIHQSFIIYPVVIAVTIFTTSPHLENMTDKG